MSRPQTCFLACLLCTVFALPVDAATLTWTGATNSDWATGSNWGGTAPTSATNDIANIPNTATSPILSTAGATATDVRVGSTAAAASLTINGNGVLTNANGYVGYTGGSTGAATVTGSSAQWINNTLLYVGHNGSGTLNVQNEALVTGAAIRIANNATSIGTVTVTGSNSRLNSTSTSVVVGQSGTGILNIQNGGSVTTATDLYLGSASGSNGTINISGATSQATASNVYVGNLGTGTLNMTGGTLNANNFFVATASSSTSSATIDGVGTKIISAGQLYIGRAGAGSMTIQNGATVNGLTSRIGSDTGSSGTLTINGAGSQYIAGSAMSVGSSGSGTLNVQNGGKITVAGTFAFANSANSTGTGTITGANSEAIVTGSAIVGNNGNATLTISNGGLLSNTATGGIASVNGYTSSVLIDGANSRWINGNGLNIGNSGNGTLTIQAGGFASAISSVSVGSSSTGNGTLNINGTGSQLTNSAAIRIGDSGTGSLNITNGGVLTTNIGNTTYSYVGSSSTSSGNVSVSGAGSSWNNFQLHIGNSGTGTVVINQGGSIISSGAGYLGSNASGSGTLIVTNAGSNWSVADNLVVGQLGNGTLTISNGATASALTNYIGRYGNASGTVLLTGHNSTWNSNTDLAIGGEGSGSLTLQDGAMANVTSGGDYTYKYSGGISENRISTATIYIAVSSSSTGTLNIGADALSAAAAAGLTNAESIQFGLGTGKIVFNHTGTAYNFAANLIGNGTLQFVAGNTLLTGNNTLFTGTVTGTGTMTVSSGETNITTNNSGFAGNTAVSGGILRVNGSLGGTTTVSGTGRLQGNSTLGGLVVNSGGTVAPGNSIGTVNTTNVTYNPGSTYEVEVNSAGESDRIIASGTATLNGGTVKAIPYPDFVANSPYTILTAAGGIMGSFSGTEDDYLFLSSFLTQDSNNVYLTLTGNNAAIQSFARSPNQRAVASAIDDATLNDNTAIGALYLSASAEDLGRNLDRLSGEIHASTQSVLINDQRFLREAILGSGNRSDDLALKGANGKIWMRAFGNWGETDGTSKTASLDTHTTGFLAGMEKQDGDAKYGVGFGASHTNINQDSLGSEAKANNYHTIIYAGKDIDKIAKITGGASYTFHDIDTSRDVNIATFNDTSKADYHAHTAQVFGEVSHDFAPNVNNNKTRAEIYAQGAYILHKSDSFNEDGEAGLKGDSETTGVATSTLGLRMHREFETDEKRYFTLQGGIAWQHAYGDETPERDARFTGTSADNKFTVQGAPIGRDTALVNLGVGLYVSPNLSYSVSYDGAVSQETSQHGITGHVKWKF